MKKKKINSIPINPTVNSKLLGFDNDGNPRLYNQKSRNSILSSRTAAGTIRLKTSINKNDYNRRFYCIIYLIHQSSPEMIIFSFTTSSSGGNMTAVHRLLTSGSGLTISYAYSEDGFCCLDIAHTQWLFIQAESKVIEANTIELLIL